MFFKNEKNLISYANTMSGHKIYKIANKLNILLPENTKNKGYIGNIIEKFFFINSGNRPIRDFYHIGIELKTISIDKNNDPLEATFICTASLIKNNGITWKKSYIYYKLRRILWIPIKVNRFLPLKEYTIGIPFLWSPNVQEEKKIKKDWEDIMDIIVLGKIDKLNSSYGEVLQVKKKANNNKSLTRGVGKYGQPIFTTPRGFYLRKNFTNLLIKKSIIK